MMGTKEGGGEIGSFKTKSEIRTKTSAPGSAAARDKWLAQKEVGILRKSSAPGSAAAPDKWFVQKSLIF